MMDREKVEAILRRRFPEARLDQVAAAVNAIMGLGDEWQEIKCTDPRNLDREFRNGIELRFYRRGTADDQH
jgi:hypothetical protein